MTNQISVESLSAIAHNGVPVITTELMASLYCTERQRITNNFNRNKERFTEGKHHYKLTGEELRSFKHRNSLRVPVKSRAIILWTERGAARHAKMLETDQAWDVFEKLEDFYFNQKEEAAKLPKPRKSSADERTPLRQYVEKLIANKTGMKYPDIWKLVHDRFDVEHINQLTATESMEAVEYLRAREGEFLGKHEKEFLDIKGQVNNINAACFHLDYIYQVWKQELHPALVRMESPLAAKLYDHIISASVLVRSHRKQLEEQSGLSVLQYK